MVYFQQANNQRSETSFVAKLNVKKFMHKGIQGDFDNKLYDLFVAYKDEFSYCLQPVQDI